MAFALPQTRTTFFSDGPVTFQVEIDGRLVNRRPERAVNLDQLSPGRHYVRVITEGYRGRTSVYSGNIRLRPDYHTRFLVNSNRGMGVTLTLAQEEPLYRAPVYGVRPGGRGDHHGGHTGHHATCGGGGCNGGCWMMSPAQVENILYAMRHQPFDEDKWAVAHRALRSGPPIRSADLVVLLNQFAFDRHRLELAKFAYENVADPENYFLVYNAFTFSSSRRELDIFLGRGNNSCAPAPGYYDRDDDHPGRGHGRGRGRRG